MILAALLLAAHPVEPETAVEAEAAFAKDAREIGQWTAFERWADETAILVQVPELDIRTLDDSGNPAISLQWWPTKSFVSCDGKMAANTGAYYSPMDGTFGQFMTVWHKTGSGWRYLADHGVELEKPLPVPETPEVTRASCDGVPIVTEDSFGIHYQEHYSQDRTIKWTWFAPTNGDRILTVEGWNGRAYEEVMTLNRPNEAPAEQ